MEQLKYQTMSEIEDVHWWFVARREILDRKIKSFNLPKDARILEVGCGTGGNLKMLAKYGEVYAIELDDYAKKKASQKNIAKEIRSGKLPEELVFEDVQFDMIVMFDVLEHIEEDSETIQVLEKLLKDGGIFFATVPAFSFLWSEDDVINQNKRRYNKKMLQDAFRESNLKINFISYFNFWLFPVILTIRMVSKILRKKDLVYVVAPKNSFVNKILKVIFASERFILDKIRLPFGVSLMIQARK